jgi:signal transduction histidine kinase
MEKQYFQSERADCPVCHFPFDSSRHEVTCKAEPVEVIVEVTPPERDGGRASGPGKRGTDQGKVEDGLFPIVSAAHEFKTPLVVMLGYTDLLRSGHLGPINTRQNEVLGEMQEGAQRLQKLIQDLLLLSDLRSPRAAEPDRDAEPADVNEHLQEIFSYWLAMAKQKSISYELQLAATRPRVKVDPLKLQHIVSNLIENALKFTPQRGHVAVTVTPCFWERRKAQSHFLFNMERKRNVKINNAVRIDVSDTGPGIPPEHHHDIFADFVQLPGASSRGTGLGLAIARRMVESHGGAIWVESTPGQGSKFSVLLTQSR